MQSIWDDQLAIESRGGKLHFALSLQEIDVQLFGEALAGLTSLTYQRELVPFRTDHVSSRVRKILERADFKFRCGRESSIAG